MKLHGAVGASAQCTEKRVENTDRAEHIFEFGIALYMNHERKQVVFIVQFQVCSYAPK